MFPIFNNFPKAKGLIDCRKLCNFLPKKNKKIRKTQKIKNTFKLNYLNKNKNKKLFRKNKIHFSLLLL